MKKNIGFLNKSINLLIIYPYLKNKSDENKVKAIQQAHKVSQFFLSDPSTERWGHPFQWSGIPPSIKKPSASSLKHQHIFSDNLFLIVVDLNELSLLGRFSSNLKKIPKASINLERFYSIDKIYIVKGCYQSKYIYIYIHVMLKGKRESKTDPLPLFQ